MSLSTYPAFATLIDCCSIASWMLILSCSLMLLNSSMQHRPPSARTRAPASRCQSTPSFTAVTVSPTQEILSLVKHIQNANLIVCTTHMEEIQDRRVERSQQWSQIGKPVSFLNVCILFDLLSLIDKLSTFLSITPLSLLSFFLSSISLVSYNT